MNDGVAKLIDEPVEIAVVDYGMGNRRSVEKALEHVGARALVTSEHAQLCAATGLVVPGVGAFPRAMERMRALGLDELLRERIDAGTPVLGVCLGMQLAFESSTELGGATGLGIMPGEVRALAPGSLKLPHIGWNEVSFTTPPRRWSRSSRAGAPSTTCTRSLPSPPRSRMCWAWPSTVRRS